MMDPSRAAKGARRRAARHRLARLAALGVVFVWPAYGALGSPMVAEAEGGAVECAASPGVVSAWHVAADARSPFEALDALEARHLESAAALDGAEGWSPVEPDTINGGVPGLGLRWADAAPAARRAGALYNAPLDGTYAVEVEGTPPFRLWLGGALLAAADAPGGERQIRHVRLSAGPHRLFAVVGGGHAARLVVAATPTGLAEAVRVGGPPSARVPDACLLEVHASRGGRPRSDGWWEGADVPEPGGVADAARRATAAAHGEVRLDRWEVRRGLDGRVTVRRQMRFIVGALGELPTGEVVGGLAGEGARRWASVERLERATLGDGATANPQIPAPLKGWDASPWPWGAGVAVGAGIQRAQVPSGTHVQLRWEATFAGPGSVPWFTLRPELAWPTESWEVELVSEDGAPLVALGMGPPHGNGSTRRATGPWRREHGARSLSAGSGSEVRVWPWLAFDTDPAPEAALAAEGSAPEPEPGVAVGRGRLALDAAGGAIWEVEGEVDRADSGWWWGGGEALSLERIRLRGPAWRVGAWFPAGPRWTPRECAAGSPAGLSSPALDWSVRVTAPEGWRLAPPPDVEVSGPSLSYSRRTTRVSDGMLVERRARLAPSGVGAEGRCAEIARWEADPWVLLNGPAR